MPAAARITDMHICPKVEPGPKPHVGGPVVSGDNSVIIGRRPAARVGDSLVCIGPKASDNPWEALTLEWQSPSPPPHDNFIQSPVVTSGPYEYRS